MTNRLCTLILAVACFTASAQSDIDYPYNPDFENDGFVGIEDVLELLSVYGAPFTPEQLLLDGASLTEIIESLQTQIDSLASFTNEGFGALVLNDSLLTEYLVGVAAASEEGDSTLAAWVMQLSEVVEQQQAQLDSMEFGAATNLGLFNQSWSYPQGRGGETLVLHLTDGQEYQVPEGFNFYVHMAEYWDCSNEGVQEAYGGYVDGVKFHTTSPSGFAGNGFAPGSVIHHVGCSDYVLYGFLMPVVNWVSHELIHLGPGESISFSDGQYFFAHQSEGDNSQLGFSVTPSVPSGFIQSEFDSPLKNGGSFFWSGTITNNSIASCVIYGYVFDATIYNGLAANEVSVNGNSASNNLAAISDVCELDVADIGGVYENYNGTYEDCLSNYGSYCDSTWQIHVLPDSIEIVFRGEEDCTPWDEVLVPRTRTNSISCFNCTLYEAQFFGFEEDYLILRVNPLVELSETSHLGVGHEPNAKCTFVPFHGTWLRE